MKTYLFWILCILLFALPVKSQVDPPKHSSSEDSVDPPQDPTNFDHSEEPQLGYDEPQSAQDPHRKRELHADRFVELMAGIGWTGARKAEKPSPIKTIGGPTVTVGLQANRFTDRGTLRFGYAFGLRLSASYAAFQCKSFSDDGVIVPEQQRLIIDHFSGLKTIYTASDLRENQFQLSAKLPFMLGIKWTSHKESYLYYLRFGISMDFRYTVANLSGKLRSSGEMQFDGDGQSSPATFYVDSSMATTLEGQVLTNIYGLCLGDCQFSKPVAPQFRTLAGSLMIDFSRTTQVYGKWPIWGFFAEIGLPNLQRNAAPFSIPYWQPTLASIQGLTPRNLPWQIGFKLGIIYKSPQ